MGGSSLNATELAQLADNVALMWLKTREDREPMCLIHVRFIFNILREYPHEIVATELYQLLSISLEFLALLVLHWPSLVGQGMLLLHIADVIWLRYSRTPRRNSQPS
jgi:hypothetical protein